MRFCCLIFFLISSFFVIAQNEVTLSGSVTDEMGTPIPQAEIKINGRGVIYKCNADGEFEIKISSLPKNAFLEVSAKNFETIRIDIGEQREFTIVLLKKEDTLKEVVVTSGYGTKKFKEEVVGSITTLKAKDIQLEQAFESIDRMLDGLAPGVLIENNTNIGGAISVDIRGKGTLTPLNNNILSTSTQPLYVIDGIVLTEESGFDNELFDGRGGISETFLNPLTKIAPQDIESVSILKDAAAVGLYGADAANGVIIITTKRGKKGKPVYNLNAQTGISSAINRIKYMSGEQYNEMRNEVLINRGDNPIPFNGVDTDWFGLLNRNGTFARYNFGMNGGFKNYQFRASFNHQNFKENQIGNEYQTFSTMFSFGYHKDRLNINLMTTPSYNIKTFPNSLYGFALFPTLPPYDSNGNFSETGTNGIPNPLAITFQNRNVTKTYGLLSSLNVNYEILKGIKANFIFGNHLGDKNQDDWFSGLNESGRRSGTFIYEGVTYPNWGRRSIRIRRTTRWNSSFNLAYEKSWNNKHFFDAIVGVEIQKELIRNSREAGTGFPVSNIIQPPLNANLRDFIDNNGDGINDNTSGYAFNTFTSDQRRRSTFAQANYNFQKKYFFLINVRQDESSAFGSNKNVALNGGIGASWVISNENFLKNSSWLNFLRYKISYGITGNSRIGSFRSAGLYNLDTSGQSGYNGGSFATPSTPPNPNLTWESNYKFNTGVDIHLFRRFRLGVEYFRDDLKNLITSRPVPTETGYSSAQINGAAMYNRGVELALDVDIFKGSRFNWNSGFVFSKIENKITDLKGLGSTASSDNTRVRQVGTSNTAIWGYLYGGVDPATGLNLYIIDGQVYDQQFFNQNIQGRIEFLRIIGDSQPAFFGGWNNRLTYKNFSLQFRFTYRWDYDELISRDLIDNYRITINRNLSVNAVDRWRQPGDISLYPMASENAVTIANASKYVFDASHIKLQNINFAYLLELNKYKERYKFFIQRVAISLDVTNVFYWYKVKSPPGRNGIQEFRFTYPESRTITLGLNFNF